MFINALHDLVSNFDTFANIGTCFIEGDPDATGGGNPDVEPAPDPAQEPDTGDEKKFTQTDMSALAAKESAKAEARGRRKAEEGRDAAIEAARTAAVEEYRSELGLTEEVIAALPQQPEVERALRAEKSAHGKSAKRVTTLEAENQTLRTALEGIVARDAVFSAASSKARDPHDIWLRLAPRMGISPDGINPVLRDSSGTTLADTADEVAEALPGIIDEILAAAPHLAAPTGAEGSGSSPQRSEAAAVQTQEPDRTTPQGALAYLRQNKDAFQR
tara:strand:- start:3558 stop:4379 length:822 start_codon:yes stop_codon:yes gene_type:complete